MPDYKSKLLQSATEHEAFRALMVRENAKSYLEIGSYCGGSLWSCANILPKGSRVVAVDKPVNSPEPSQASLEACVADLKTRGYDAHLFLGDSRSPSIIKWVQALAPFDVCFIDANHTLPYVTADFENYGSLARIVAFHDIGWVRDYRRFPGGSPIQVPQFWDSIKDKYRHVEFKYDPKTKDNGIGVLWRG